MGELSHLADELRASDKVSHVREVEDPNIVKFRVNHGKLDALRSDVISTLGRYDCDVFSNPDHYFQWWAVAP